MDTLPSRYDAAVEKMAGSGARPIEVHAFRYRLGRLASGDLGTIPGDALTPLDDVPVLDELPQPAEPGELLSKLVVMKLNGGLGTSMGLTGPKSLLPVKPDTTFLDVVATQVLALRERHGAAVPFVMMTSANTREPSLAALAARPAIAEQPVPLDFTQGREPKLREDDGSPVEWQANPDLEWCPAGHGDLFTSFAASGMLDTLVDAGFRWCFVSNVDNLGATVDLRIAQWLAATDTPFLMEVVRGTAADRKAGHLARHGDRIVLRESAQVPDGDTSFGDVERWKYYNTNNLWIDLPALRALQAADPSAPQLPIIVNRKTVDPADASSPRVVQLETAMGAAIGAIDGARAIEVPRSRFAPVKTTDDLLVVRSDAYELTADGEMRRTFDGTAPFIALEKDLFKLVPDFDARFPAGAPSLRRCDSLVVEGDVTFGADVTVEGTVTVTGPAHVEDGTTLTG